VLADFYAKISSLTGLKFDFVRYATHGEAVAAVKDKQADILGLFSDGQINAYNEGLSPTREYGTVNMVFVTEAGLKPGAYAQGSCEAAYPGHPGQYPDCG
jgi:adenosylcobinamide amidohydrolase